MIMRHMGVPGEKVVELFFAHDALNDAHVITVGDSDHFAINGNLPQRVTDLQMQIVCIAAERIAIPIIVAPDKSTLKPGKCIKDFFTTHIAAVNVEIRAGIAQKLESEFQ